MKKMSLKEFDKFFESLKNWGVWGDRDELGTLNYLTPDRIRQAALLVKSGRTVSMSLPVNTAAGPDNPNPPVHFMCLTHDVDPGAGEGLAFATDYMSMRFHGDCQTHLDALCHVSYKGLLYNGRPANSVTVRGAGEFDVTSFSNGVAGRGVLVDIPRLRGVKWLEPGEAVLPEELEAFEAEVSIQLGEGDIMLFRTGHHRRRIELGPWDPGPSGLGRAGLHPLSVRWMRERKISAFLPDGDGETVPSTVEGLDYPIHPLQVTAMGMCVADSINLEGIAGACEKEGRWEFFTVFSPLFFPNATGSPFTPIAIL